MSLRCPECGHGLSHWETPKFLRLHSISCRRCNSPLALSNRGRIAFTISILAAILLSVLIAAATGHEFVLVIGVIVGFVIGSMTGASYGRLFVSGGEQGGKTDNQRT
jgi:uncharacterized protein (DUF983 family)